MIDLSFYHHCPLEGGSCRGKSCALWYAYKLEDSEGTHQGGLCSIAAIAPAIDTALTNEAARAADALEEKPATKTNAALPPAAPPAPPAPSAPSTSKPTGRPRYAAQEVTLFKDNHGCWVVEYLGSGCYFDSFQGAVDYIRKRHEKDAMFGTRGAVYD